MPSFLTEQKNVKIKGKKGSFKLKNLKLIKYEGETDVDSISKLYFKPESRISAGFLASYHSANLHTSFFMKPLVFFLFITLKSFALDCSYPGSFFKRSFCLLGTFILQYITVFFWPLSGSMSLSLL